MEVEPIEPVPMNMYQSNTYIKDKVGIILMMSEGFKKPRSEGKTVLHIGFCRLSNNSK